MPECFDEGYYQIMKYAQEPFAKVYYDGIHLIAAHHKEIDLFNRVLDVHVDAFIAAEEAGNLVTYSIRTDEDELVGYCVFYVYMHGHHKQDIHAKQDVIFIDKKYRGHASEFISYCDKQLKESGVQYVHQCVPVMNDFSRLLERKGYKKLETIYARRL